MISPKVPYFSTHRNRHVAFEDDAWACDRSNVSCTLDSSRTRWRRSDRGPTWRDVLTFVMRSNFSSIFQYSTPGPGCWMLLCCVIIITQHDAIVTTHRSAIVIKHSPSVTRAHVSEYREQLYFTHHARSRAFPAHWAAAHKNQVINTRPIRGQQIRQAHHQIILPPPPGVRMCPPDQLTKSLSHTHFNMLVLRKCSPMHKPVI
jgi:hypothetical protein